MEYALRGQRRMRCEASAVCAARPASYALRGQRRMRCEASAVCAARPAPLAYSAARAVARSKVVLLDD